MSKQIIFNKLIINLENEEVVIHYKLKIDGAIDNKKFYTLNVTSNINTEKLQEIIISAKNQLNLIEGV